MGGCSTKIYAWSDDGDLREASRPTVYLAPPEFFSNRVTEVRHSRGSYRTSHRASPSTIAVKPEESVAITVRTNAYQAHVVSAQRLMNSQGPAAAKFVALRDIYASETQLVETVRRWEEGTSETLFMDACELDVAAGALPPLAAPAMRGKPIFQCFLEQVTAGTKTVCQAFPSVLYSDKQCVAFVPAGFRGNGEADGAAFDALLHKARGHRPTAVQQQELVNSLALTPLTINPASRNHGRSAALMSLVHVLVIPRRRIYNAVTLTAADVPLVSSARTRGARHTHPSRVQTSRVQTSRIDTSRARHIARARALHRRPSGALLAWPSQQCDAGAPTPPHVHTTPHRVHRSATCRRWAATACARCSGLMDETSTAVPRPSPRCRARSRSSARPPTCPEALAWGRMPPSSSGAADGGASQRRRSMCAGFPWSFPCTLHALVMHSPCPSPVPSMHVPCAWAHLDPGRCGPAARSTNLHADLRALPLTISGCGCLVGSPAAVNRLAPLACHVRRAAHVYLRLPRPQGVCMPSY